MPKRASGGVIEIQMDRLVFDFRRDYGQVRECILQILRFFPHKYVLDIGAGEGRISHSILSSFPESRITFLDRASSEIDIAKRRLQTYLRRVKFVVGDMKEFKSRKKFDIAVCNLLTHSIGDRKTILAILKKIKSLLRKEGILFFGDLFSFEYAPLNRYSNMCGNAPALSFLELGELVTEAGFTVWEILYFRDNVGLFFIK